MPAERGQSRRVLRQAIGGQRRLVAAGSALAGLHQFGEALVPVLIGVIVDRAVEPGSAGALAGWLVALAVLFAGLSVSFRYGLRLSERAGEQAGHELRLALTRRVLDPRGGAERGRLPGALVNIATEDARRVGNAVAVLPFGLAAVAGLLICAVALLRLSVPLGVLVLVGTPLLVGLARLAGRPLERRSEVEQERAAQAAGLAADLVTGLRVLKGIGAEAAAVDRYRRTSQYSLAATLRAARAQAWHDAALLTAAGLVIAAVALVGGRLAAGGSLSVGGLVAAVGLAQFLLVPLSTLGWVNGELAQGRGSAVRVAAVLGAAPAVHSGPGPLAAVLGRVRLAGVRLDPLHDVTLDVPAGELVGIVAEPAAATALLDCLGRSAEPAAGLVTVDEVDLSTVDIAAVRAAVLVAAHDADLFEGSLLGNVDPAGTFSPATVQRALVAAAADEVAGSLPSGVDSPVTERGRSLSGGQRQRVALARALAADPLVLVLHDPTTAVDAATEARIATGLRAARQGRTTIVLTTSPALLAVADRVVLLRDGTVAACGRHADLLADAGYRATVLA